MVQHETGRNELYQCLQGAPRLQAPRPPPSVLPPLDKLRSDETALCQSNRSAKPAPMSRSVLYLKWNKSVRLYHEDFSNNISENAYGTKKSKIKFE